MFQAVGDVAMECVPGVLVVDNETCRTSPDEDTHTGPRSIGSSYAMSEITAQHISTSEREGFTSK